MTSNFKGKHHNDETKVRIREKMKGKKNNLGKHWKLSEETKQKMSLAKLGNKYSLGKFGRKPVGKGWKKYDLPFLKETDLAYIAGIVDGEGSISIQQNGKHQIAHLTISNTNLEVLKWIQNKFEEGTIYKRTLYPNRKQCYVWQTGAHKVIYLILIKLLPYLKIKRNKAIETISFIQNKEIKP